MEQIRHRDPISANADGSRIRRFRLPWTVLGVGSVSSEAVIEPIDLPDPGTDDSRSSLSKDNRLDGDK